MVPNLKNTALIFLEIFVIEYCTVLVDCEQSLFSSKIRGERTQNKKTCKRDCERDLRAAMPRAASSVVDCEQSLFSSKIRGKERKTRKHASVTVSVT